MFEIRNYLTETGRDVFMDWYTSLRDINGKKTIGRRLLRLALGHFSDCKPIQDGVWELRIDVGPGYRLYYARAGHTLMLLLCGGNKRTQQADISSALAYWRDWQQKNPKEQTGEKK